MHQLAFVRATSSPGLFHFLREKPWGRGRRQRTSFSVTLSREKPCPVGSSLCTTVPSFQKQRIFLSSIFFRGGGVCTQASRPKKKKTGGCLAASTDCHFSHNNHYQLKPAVIILLTGKLKMSM